jgi:hypothetical protein
VMTTDRRMGACSSPAPSELLTGWGSVAETSACNVRVVVSAASAGKEAGCRNLLGTAAEEWYEVSTTAAPSWTLAASPGRSIRSARSTALLQSSLSMN